MDKQNNYRTRRPIYEKYSPKQEILRELKNKDSTEVIDLVTHDRQYANTKDFYANLSQTVLHNLLATVFHKKQSKFTPSQLERIQKIVRMLKCSLGFLQYIHSNPTFNRNLVFGFLNSEPVPESTVGILADLFLIYARYAPDLTISIIKEENTQHLITSNLRKGQIFSIVYTTVFSLNSETSELHPKFIPKVLFTLIHLIFEDDSGNSIFGQNDTEFDADQIPIDQLTSRLRVRNRQHPFFKENNQSFIEEVIDICSNMVQMVQEIFRSLSTIYKGNFNILLQIILSEQYIPKIFILMRLTLQSKCSKELQDSLCQQLLKFMNILIEKDEDVTRRTSLSKTTSLASSFNEIHQGTPLLPHNQNCKKSSRISIDFDLNLPSIPEDIYLFRQSAQKYLKQIPSQVQEERLARDHTEFQKMKKLLKLITIQIVKQLEKFETFQRNLIESQTDQMRKKNKKQYFIEQVSGQDTMKVTLRKYWQLKLHLSILKFIQINHHLPETELKILRNATYSIIPICFKCLRTSRWNNITQCIIVKLIRAYVSVCYEEFYEKVIHIEDPSKGFLGYIVESWRNPYYYHLETMKRTPFGDRNNLYLISKAINGQLSTRGKLKALFEKFPLWSVFSHKQLEDYEEILSKSEIFDELGPLPDLTRSQSAGDTTLSSLENGETPPKLSIHNRKNSMEERIAEMLKEPNQCVGDYLEYQAPKQKYEEDVKQKTYLRDFTLYYRSLQQQRRQHMN